MILFLLLLFSCRCIFADVVISTTKIQLADYPDAYNPSLIKVDDQLLLIFRYRPDPDGQPWLSYIGLVHLNQALRPCSEPQLLPTRFQTSKTPSQSEDARIFAYRGRLFLIYNDNIDLVCPPTWERRDMFLTELHKNDGQYTLSAPLKLYYEEKRHVLWQKNWVPFVWNNTLLLGYSINPHEIIYPNLISGACYHCYESSASITWNFGTLRGSTPAQLVDNEYLAFFHSGTVLASPASQGFEMWHYFMGAYTFSPDPPFNITKMSPAPLMADGFYTLSDAEKRVIFPGGFVVSGEVIYLAYGKDDREIWIATLDKEALKKTLLSVP